MKGIYLLESSPDAQDLYWICRSRGIFEYVTVAFALSSRKSGKDYHLDIMRVKKVLDNSCGLTIDFFKQGQHEAFLKRSSTSFIPVIRNEVFHSISEKGIDTRLVVPGHKPESYSSVNFPKYFF